MVILNNQDSITFDPSKIDLTRLRKLLKAIKIMENLNRFSLIMPKSGLPDDIHNLLTMKLDEFIDLFLSDPTSFPTILTYLRQCEED